MPTSFNLPTSCSPCLSTLYPVDKTVRLSLGVRH
jgi:hypothetical protein